MEKSAGLILITTDTNIKGSNIVAWLRRRGNWSLNEEKPTTRRGSCQVTAHGVVEKNENFEDAFRRELEEELGNNFYNAIDFSRVKLINSTVDTKHEKHVKTYCIEVPYETLKLIKQSPCGGGIEPITLNEAYAIEGIVGDYPSDHVFPLFPIAMWKDAKESVIKALKTSSQ